MKTFPSSTEVKAVFLKDLKTMNLGKLEIPEVRVSESADGYSIVVIQDFSKTTKEEISDLTDAVYATARLFVRSNDWVYSHAVEKNREGYVVRIKKDSVYFGILLHKAVMKDLKAKGLGFPYIPVIQDTPTAITLMYKEIDPPREGYATVKEDFENKTRKILQGAVNKGEGYGCENGVAEITLNLEDVTEERDQKIAKTFSRIEKMIKENGWNVIEPYTKSNYQGEASYSIHYKNPLSLAEWGKPIIDDLMQKFVKKEKAKKEWENISWDGKTLKFTKLSGVKKVAMKWVEAEAQRATIQKAAQRFLEASADERKE